MDDLLRLDLIRVFGFYLWLILLISTYRRFTVYREIARLVFNVPARWPRLFVLIKEHRIVFLTWSTFRPVILTLIVATVYMIASRVIWPQARLTVNDLLHNWWMLPVVASLGAAMLAVDLYTVVYVSTIDRNEITKQLDEAEYWMKSWKAPVVRFVTLGYVDPRKMVREEVRKAMLAGRDLLHQTLWWMMLQMGLRVAFGLALWLTWIYFPTGG